MPAVWQYHPRYSLSLFVLLAFTLYVILPHQPQRPLYAYRPPVDNGLPARISRSEARYNKMLDDRQALIKKFGPSPNDVATFPPDKDPWPAYTVWDFFPSLFNCPHEVERIGNIGDGGKWLCGLSRVEEKPDCVVYSIGHQYETSFERDVLERTTDCKIWAYDWTVKGLYGIPRPYRHRTQFEPFQLADVDAHGPDDKPKKYTLETLMSMNEHKHIDILKVDSEGLEWVIFTKFVRRYVSEDRPLPFGQLIVELHLWNMKFSQVLAFWELMEEAGLRPFRSEPNLVYQNYNKAGNPDLQEYTFLNIRGQNIFIHDPTDPPSENPDARYIRHGPRTGASATP